jgi:hypothetical protein
MVVDKFVDWLASLIVRKEDYKPKNILLDVFRITKIDIGERVKVVINNKLMKEYLIHTKTSSRFTEGEVISYSNLI